MDFFSARLLLVCLVDTGRRRRKNLYDHSVIVFRARSDEHAFTRAVEIGRSNEVEYRNYKGERVRWALVRVLNIERIGQRVDGEEVASTLDWHESNEPLSFDHVFRPEDELPGPNLNVPVNDLGEPNKRTCSSVLKGEVQGRRRRAR